MKIRPLVKSYAWTYIGKGKGGADTNELYNLPHRKLVKNIPLSYQFLKICKKDESLSFGNFTYILICLLNRMQTDALEIQRIFGYYSIFGFGRLILLGLKIT